MPNIPPLIEEGINSRRRLLTKAGLASPVVLSSLISRPVLGDTPYSCTISGQMSGNTSFRPGQVRCAELGRSPGYWGNRGGQHDWSPLRKEALFASVFADAYPGKTLLQVIQSGGGMTPNNNYPALGRSAVASWLNAYHMPSYPFTQAKVTEMFNAVATGGAYHATANWDWDAHQVHAYFESLYG